MHAPIETLKMNESREEAEIHTLSTDFHIPEWVVVPESVSEGYAKLGEAGREDVHSKIEQALAGLEARISSTNKATSHNLEQYTIYG